MSCEADDYSKPTGFRADPIACHNRRKFVECLEKTQAWLLGEGIDYRIVGSVAVSAYTNSESNFNRPYAFADHQRIPDIDLITPRDRVPDTRRYHTELLKTDFPVFLGIVPAIAEVDFRPDEQYSYLRHKKLTVPIKTQVFDAQQVKFDDAEVTTVNPVTLRGLYENGAWLGKQKDKAARASLTEVIEAEYSYDPADYAAFQEYIAKRKQQYPGFLLGKLAVEKTLAALPPLLASVIRHYGAKAFIEGNAISMLAYKPE